MEARVVRLVECCFHRRFVREFNGVQCQENRWLCGCEGVSECRQGQREHHEQRTWEVIIWFLVNLRASRGSAWFDFVAISVCCCCGGEDLATKCVLIRLIWLGLIRFVSLCTDRGRRVFIQRAKCACWRILMILTAKRRVRVRSFHLEQFWAFPGVYIYKYMGDFIFGCSSAK